MNILKKHHSLTVVCVLKVGSFRKRGYSALWVHKLRNMVQRNLSTPHNFICLTNTDIPDIECVSLIDNYIGWWSKIELFRDDIPGDRFLYLDLDLLVLQDLSLFIEINKSVIICKAFGKASGDDKTVHGYNSSVMVFDKGALSDLYFEFGKSDIKKFRGDQDYIKHNCTDLPTFPDKWINKIRYCTSGKKCEPSEDVKVLLCMPHKNDVAIHYYPWMRKVWK